MTTLTHDERHTDYIVTYTGRVFHPLSLDEWDFNILDIAHALSKLCRWTGQSYRHISIAQHSVLVSYQVSPQAALTALLHDGAEAYLNDLSRPVKHQLPQFVEADTLLTRKVMMHFDGDENFNGAIWKEVKAADERLLVTEARDFTRAHGTGEWQKHFKEQPLAVTLRSWPAWYAKLRFLVRYAALTGNYRQLFKAWVAQKVRDVKEFGLW